MTYTPSLIPRRFVRTMAMHHLYAFHIRQQATYHNALSEIESAFQPDVFSPSPLNAQQLAGEKMAALQVFKDGVAEHRLVGVQAFPKSPENNAVANKLWESYQNMLSQEVNVLKNGMQATLRDACNAYLLTLQLMVEWFMIAEKQVQESEQLAIPITAPTALAHNRILATWRNHPGFQDLLAERNVAWNKDIHVVVRWYNQFIKHAAKLQHAHTNNGKRSDEEIVSIILHQIIGGQDDIQQYFENLYLHWEEIKCIVKSLWPQVDINSILAFFQQQETFTEPSIAFYTQLIENTLTQDAALETLIQQYAKSWALERLVLVDRIILKIGLCEMQYLADTPGKVVISEYVYLAKKYSTAKSLAFVNGILDAVAKEHNFVT